MPLAATAPPETAAHGRPFTWIRDMGPQGRRAFAAAFSGWALEAADAQTFGLVLPLLATALGLSGAATGTLASVTLVCTAVGGWLAGWASDRFGRMRVLRATVLVYAVATALLGFSQNFGELVAFRSLQGFGFGGEWSAGAALVSEYVVSRHRGKALGAVQSGWGVGWGLALGAYAIVNSLAGGGSAWRIMFWLGLLPALLVMLLRRGGEDAPRTDARRGEDRSATGISRIFRRDLLRASVTGGLLGLGSHGGYYALTTFLPSYLQKQRGLSAMDSTAYLGVYIAASFLGYLASGYLSDRIGRRRNVVIFAICCVASLMVYLFAPLSNSAVMLVGAPLGFFSAGIPGSLGSIFADLYPAEIRGQGQGFCYNFGRLVSAVFPMLVGALSARVSIGTAVGIFAGIAYGIAVLSALALPKAHPAISAEDARSEASR